MTWTKGQSGNPKGRKASVFHTFADTAGQFLEEMTRDELIAISDDDEKLNAYPAFKAMVLMQLGNALKRSTGEIDLTVERERLYDRTIGKAAQTVAVNHTGAVAVFTADLSPITDFLGEFTVRKENLPLSSDVPSGLVLSAPVCAE
jgi:uncharacterized protein DUF5681